MEQKQIEAAIRKVRKRLSLQFLTRWLLIGLAVGLLSGTSWLLISRLWVIPSYRWWAVLFVFAVFLSAIAFAWMRRPTIREAVRCMDEPTENRVSTALKYADDTSALAVLQRKETVHAADAFVRQLPKTVPLMFPRKWMTSAFVLLTVFVLLWFIPNPADEVLAKKQLEEKWIKEQEEKVEELIEEQQSELAEAEQLPEVEAVDPEVEAKLTQLLDQLRQSEQSLEALEKLEQTLKALNESLEALEKELQKTEQQLSEQGSGENSGSSSNDNGESAGGDSTAERKRQLEELKRNAEDAARALAQMGLPAARELANEGISVSDTWTEGGLASELAGSPGEGSSSSDPQGSGSNAGEGQNTGAGETPSGEGSSGQQGSGGSKGQNGEGQGSGSQPGSGSGTGSGQTGGSGTGSGQGGQGGLQGGFGSGSRSEVTTPRIFEDEGETEVDGGPVNGDGGDTEQTGRGNAEQGSATPYEQVYGSYEQEARQTIERSPIPDSMKHMVRDYFINIQPGS